MAAGLTGTLGVLAQKRVVGEQRGQKESATIPRKAKREQTAWEMVIRRKPAKKLSVEVSGNKNDILIS